MAMRPQQIECLVAALLAVNQFPVDKVRGLLPRMRESGLTSPARVAKMDMAEAIEALVGAGYDRKKLNWLFAERLKALMDAIETGKLSGLDASIAAADKDRAALLLRKVRGIGPTVVNNAWMLLTS
jgi:endonuclease III-like uncharacterized protein